jgi:hypothetical protein
MAETQPDGTLEKLNREIQRTKQKLKCAYNYGASDVSDRGAEASKKEEQ